MDEVKRQFRERQPVTPAELEHLAEVQGRPVDDFLTLLEVPFDQVPALTECGETPLLLQVPSQAPVMPLPTTAAGVLLAAELVKQQTGLGRPLTNYFVHDLRFRLRRDAQRFKPRRTDCQGCSSTD